MSKLEKIRFKILCGIQDKNIKFSELCILLEELGFKVRIKGSHHIYYKEGVDEILNIQPNGSQKLIR